MRSKGFTGGSVDELMVFDRAPDVPPRSPSWPETSVFGALLKRPVANWTDGREGRPFLQLYLERSRRRLAAAFSDRLKALRLERNDLMETNAQR